MMKILFVLITLITLLNVFDIYSTNYIMTRGLGYEANPIMAAMMKEYGILPALIGFKGIVILSLYVLFYLVRNKEPAQKFYIFGSLLVVIVYSYFMYNHNLQIML